jgi:uncharacterized protein YceK
MYKWLPCLLITVIFLSGCASIESKAFGDDGSVHKNESHLPSGEYIFSMYLEDEKEKMRLAEYITINHE